MSLRALMRQQVTYRPVTYGSRGPVYGDPITVPARVQFGQSLVVTKDATDVTASATVYMLPRADAPNVGDDLDLPDGTSRPIINRAEEFGAHSVLYLKLDVR